jgi:hypothetical protein
VKWPGMTHRRVPIRCAKSYPTLRVGYQIARQGGHVVAADRHQFRAGLRILADYRLTVTRDRFDTDLRPQAAAFQDRLRKLRASRYHLLLQPMHHVSHASLDVRNRLEMTNCYGSAVEVVLVFAIGPPVEIANDEHSKRTWGHRSCDRNSATLVLTECHVARRVNYVFMLIGRVVKPNWKANQSTRCDIPIQFILLVQRRRILDRRQTGAWEVREPVLRQGSV